MATPCGTAGHPPCITTVDPWTFYRGTFLLESNMRASVCGICVILIFIRLQWLIGILFWKIRSYVWRNYPSLVHIPAADSVSRRPRDSNAVDKEAGEMPQAAISKRESDGCQCRRMRRLVFVTAVMSNAGETRWRRRVTCPKCMQQTHELELIHAKIFDEDACAQFPDCYCRKTACLLVAIERYPHDYLVCLDLDVIMDDTLLGNICASPLHQTPAWFSPSACDNPVEPYFFNAMIGYFWTLLLVIGVRFAYLKTPFLAGKFMILHAPFFHDCFTMKQLERIWGRAISEDYRLANVLKEQCGRTPQILEWPVYTRPATTPATAELLWTKSRRWMQGSHTTTIRRILFWAFMSKPALVFPFLWFDVLHPWNTVTLYAVLFLNEVLSVTVAGKAITPLRFLQVFVCGIVWEIILPFMYVAWNVSDRFTWYKRTYVMSRFDDEMLYVIDTDEIPKSLLCSPIFASNAPFPDDDKNKSPKKPPQEVIIVPSEVGHPNPLKTSAEDESSSEDPVISIDRQPVGPSPSTSCADRWSGGTVLVAVEPLDAEEDEAPSASSSN
jgi:hypothetical protein